MKSLTNYFFICIIVFAVSCKDNPKHDTEVKASALPVKIKGEQVTYATDSTELVGYLAYNENATEKRPGIIIVHEWWGHNNYVRERAEMLANLGYTALAVDMYGDGKQASHPNDAGKFARSVFNNLPEAKARFDAAMKVLQAHESVAKENIAAIGYCFGGSVVLTMANSGADLDAVAAFHSGVALPVMPSQHLKARVLVCNGADDTFVSQESVTMFTKAMDSVNAKYEYINYPNAKHGFTSKSADDNAKEFNLPLAYNAEADTKSWAELQDLLKEVFDGEGK